MSWRDGCAPRPTVVEGAEVVAFDFSGADLVGERLDALHGHVTSGPAARAAAPIDLTDPSEPHRRADDDHGRLPEHLLSGRAIDARLARLRWAWDQAAADQVRANHRAAGLVAAGGPPPR